MDQATVKPSSREEIEKENALLIKQMHYLQSELERVHEVREEGVKQTASVDFHAPAHTLAPRKTGVLARLFGPPKQRNDVALIRQSGALDATWYLQQYKDVSAEEKDPVEHYCKYGAEELRNPSRYFNTKWYMDKYPDVAKKGMNPLYHYLRFGQDERRQPAPNREPGANISIVSCTIEDLKKEKHHHRAIAKARGDALASALKDRDALDERLQDSERQRQADQEQIKALRQECEILKAQIKDRDDLLKAATAEQKGLEQQLFSEQQKIAELSNREIEQQGLIDASEARAARQQIDYEKLESENVTLKTELSNLESVASAREQDLSDLRTAQEKLVADHKVLEENFQASTLEAKNAQTRAESIQKELEQQLFTQQEKLADLLNTLNSERDSAETLLKNLKQKQQECDKLDSRNKTLKEEVKNLESAQRAREQELIDFQTAQAELKADRDQLEKELLTIRSEQSRDQERITILQRDREELSAKVETNEQALANAKEQLEALTKRHEQELTALKESHATAVAEKNRLEEQLSASSEQVQEHQVIIHALRQDTDESRTDARKAEEALSQAQREVEQLEAKLTPLQQALEERQRTAEEETQQALQKFRDIKQWLITEADS
jgi:chromosome segregation ATPase